jgi:shikimate dehydrogenase
MRKFGLIGYPLGHSFSKKYFTDKFIIEHIPDCFYENYPLKSISMLPDLIASDPDLHGLNITIPFKSEVIGLLDRITEEAAEIGAVNVLKITRPYGVAKLSGFNSDVTGISDSLKPYINSRMHNAIILGTGGSSRAVTWVLKKLGFDIVRVSRKSGQDSISYSDIDSQLINKTDLIVNTTPLGMFPDIDSRPEINYKLLNNKHILFDLVYNPELTAFLKMGGEQGCTIISGIKMLHSQAEKSWEIWNDDSL